MNEEFLSPFSNEHFDEDEQPLKNRDQLLRNNIDRQKRLILDHHLMKCYHCDTDCSTCILCNKMMDNIDRDSEEIVMMVNTGEIELEDDRDPPEYPDWGL